MIAKKLQRNFRHFHRIPNYRRIFHRHIETKLSHRSLNSIEAADAAAAAADAAADSFQLIFGRKFFFSRERSLIEKRGENFQDKEAGCVFLVYNYLIIKINYN